MSRLKVVRRQGPTWITVTCTAMFPDGKPCFGDRNEHVHQPLPCKNGADDRHHAYAPPKTITVIADGTPHRIRVVR